MSQATDTKKQNPKGTAAADFQLKSKSPEAFSSMIEDELEKIREQVQNVE